MEAVLGTDKANEIISQCHDVAAQWLDLGIRLGVLLPTLETIQANHKGDVTRCLSTLISTWLKRAKGDVKEDVRPTWKSLCEALSYINRTLAETIARHHECDYINPIVSEVAAQPGAVPPAFLPNSCGCGQCTVQGWATGRVCENVYHDRSPKLLVVDPNNPQVTDLVRFEESYDRQAKLCADTSKIVDLFASVSRISWTNIANLKDEIVVEMALSLSNHFGISFPVISDINGLHNFVHSLKVSWFNFEPLRFLAFNFLTSQSIVLDNWDNYTDRFAYYCQGRNLKRYANIFFQMEHCNVFLLEVDEYYSEFTLSDIKDLRKSLSTALDISFACLHLVTVKTGSLFIYFHYGYTDYLIVFQSLSAQQLREIASIKGCRILSLVDFYDQFKYENIQEYRCLEEAVPKSDIKEDLSTSDSSEEIKLTYEQLKKELDENRTQLDQYRDELKMYKKLSLKKDMQLSEKGISSGVSDNVTLPPLPPLYPIPASPEGSATIEESSKKAGYTNAYLREKAIGEAVAEAMAEGGGELFQCNLVFHGPPGSGKSSTQDTILGEPPRPKHKQNATDILAKSVRTVCIAAITDDNQLVQVTNDDMIDMLAGEVDIILEDNKPDDQHLSKSDNPSSSINATGESLAVSLEETSDSTSAAKVPDEAIQDPSKYRPLITTEESLKQRLLDPRKRHRSRRVFNSRWLHHIDSGGQPQYLDTFPMMHRSPAHFVVVMNVTEGLDERPKVRFYNQGEDEYELPDRLVLTNREMIVRMCQIAQRTAQDTGGKFVPRVFVVGTHKDQLFPIFGRLHLKAVNSELLRIHEKYSDVLVCKVPGEQVMFAINAMAEGKERQQYTKELQQHILAATKNTGEPMKVPFNWLMFHLELDKGEGVVRISECRTLGWKMGMNEEKVRVALEFLNKAALVLYYPEDVPDLVLTKMDPFTSRLSRLIKASFLPPDKGPTKESDELRNKGVFTRTFLKRVFTDLEDSLLSEEEFLKLLVSLRIAVNIGGEEYFLPSALSLEPPPKGSSFESKSIPLSLLWGELILPHGLFPTVCVELLAGREGGYVFELHRDVPQRREEIQLSEEKRRIPGVVKLSDRQRWIEVSYSGDNSYCPTVNGIVNGATQRAIARLRHMRIGSPTIGCVCPLCIAKDHYCYLSEDRRSVSCSNYGGKTGPVTADILCWFEDNTVTPPRDATQAMKGKSTVSLCVAQVDDTILDANDEKTLDVLHYVIEVTDWKLFGLLLKLPSYELERIRRDGYDESDRLQRMVSLWLDSGTASWRALVQALFNPLMNKEELARRISQEHRY